MNQQTGQAFDGLFSRRGRSRRVSTTFGDAGAAAHDPGVGENMGPKRRYSAEDAAWHVPVYRSGRRQGLNDGT